MIKKQAFFVFGGIFGSVFYIYLSVVRPMKTWNTSQARWSLNAGFSGRKAFWNNGTSLSWACICLSMCFLKDMLGRCLCLHLWWYASQCVSHKNCCSYVCVCNRHSVFPQSNIEDMFVVANVCKSVPKRNGEHMIVFACIALGTICLLCIFSKSFI